MNLDSQRSQHNPKDVELTDYRHQGHTDNPPAYINPAYTPSLTEKGSLDSGINNTQISESIEVSGLDGKTPNESSTEGVFVIEDEEPTGFAKHVATIQTAVEEFWEEHGQKVIYAIIAICIGLYFAYFGWAMSYEFGSEDSVRLLWVTCLVVFFVLMHLFGYFFGDILKEKCSTCLQFCSTHSEQISWVVVSVIYLFLAIFIIVDIVVVSGDIYNLVPLAGIIVYVFLFFVFSYSPAHVKWRPVAWGLALQFILALIIIRWEPGFKAFRWLGSRVEEFLAHTDAGSKFLFDDIYAHFFAFKILPVVIFFSTIISMLYYTGAMQVVIRSVSSVMQTTMGTTAGESLNAAGNIFIGQSEAPLLIRPIIKDMTRSEIHAVMTGGFATIAGTVMAAYITFGAPSHHLISASVMSAPAALAMAKLFYPETEKSHTTADDVKEMEPSDAHNLIEAAAAGASASISLVANIAANLIAFLALLHFANSTLSWFGARIGHEEITIEWILSYVLYPFAFVMGVHPDDCRKLAELIGVKTILNEFVAYSRLGEILDNTENWERYMAQGNATWSWSSTDVIVEFPEFGNSTVLTNGIFQHARSRMIATYALCGFANFGSIGVMIGALGAMAPSRKSDIASVAVRAMIAGNVACFMTACVAGIFYRGE